MGTRFLASREAAIHRVYKDRVVEATEAGASGFINKTEAVDAANTRFRVGDRVACAGAECAFHAEYLALPDLLAAPVPAGVENWQAAYTTLCSIALQAVRQLESQLGDRVLVVGQGLIGLLITNLLKSAGARVMAVDLLPARKARPYPARPLPPNGWRTAKSGRPPI